MSKELDAIKYLKENKRKHWLDDDKSNECLEIIETTLKRIDYLEGELGIDLSILPRLLEIKPKDIIYVKERGIIVECEVTGNALIDGTLIVFSHYHIGHTVYTPVCHYNKYGKTWALTKEEFK